MFIRNVLLFALVAAPLGASAVSQDVTDDSAITTSRAHEKALDIVTVTASPLTRPASEVLKPTSVITGADLEDRRGATIGETVAQEPGVQSSNFGPGVGRPIIRGLEGARVQVLEGGIGALDLSGQSNDHAVTIEPFLADQVEVLKGPATLYYGGGAIGGVVNVVDGRIPETAVDGVTGRAQLAGNTVSDERNGVIRVDGGNGKIALHADYVRRYTNDFDLPGDATLRNSATDLRTKAFGMSLTNERGFAGVSVSTLDSVYGIPLGSSKQPLNPDLEQIELDPRQTRIDAKIGLNNPFTGIDKLTLRLGHNDYQHNENTPDGAGTEFNNEGYEARLEAIHSPLWGWQGAFGMQFVDRDFEAIGEETFIPATHIRDLGAFVVEQRDFAPFKLEVGARYDEHDLDVRDAVSVGKQGSSVSAAGSWEFIDHFSATINVDRAIRAPDEEELFANGPHDATGSFEIGNTELDVETANQIEFGIAFRSDDIQGKVSAYYNRYDDFIYLAETGTVDDDEGLPVRLWSQADAHFHGFEGELKAKLADTDLGRFDLRVFGDTVSARLADGGGDLPRIAPARVGGSVLWNFGDWRASVGAVGYMKQDRVAAFESRTGGFALVNAHVSYALSASDTQWELFVDGTNLTDRVAFVHTSLLKDRSPLPGMGIGFGIRAFF